MRSGDVESRVIGRDVGIVGLGCVSLWGYKSMKLCIVYGVVMMGE